MSKPNTLSVSKRKLLLAFISIALICSIGSSSVVYVMAQGGGSTPITITSGPYPGAPSYTIYTDGTTYYAKDSYGAIAFSSIDASNTLQFTINTIGTTGDYGHPYNNTGNLPKISIISPLTLNTAITVDHTLIIDFGWQAITLNAGFILPSKTSSVTFINGGFIVANGITAFDCSGVQNTVFQNLHIIAANGATMNKGISLIGDATASSNFIKLDTIYIAGATTGLYLAGNFTTGYSTDFNLDNIQIDATTNAFYFDYVQNVNGRGITAADSTNGIVMGGATMINLQNLDLERNSNAHILFVNSIKNPVAANSRITISQAEVGEPNTTTGIKIDPALSVNVRGLKLNQVSFWVASQTYISNNGSFSDITLETPYFQSGYPSLTNVPHTYVGVGYHESSSALVDSYGNITLHLLGQATSVQLTMNQNTPWIQPVKYAIGGQQLQVNFFDARSNSTGPSGPFWVYYMVDYQP